MITLIEQHQPAIHDLCRQHRSRRLELFGSATDTDAITNPNAFRPIVPA